MYKKITTEQAKELAKYKVPLWWKSRVSGGPLPASMVYKPDDQDDYWKWVAEDGIEFFVTE